MSEDIVIKEELLEADNSFAENIVIREKLPESEETIFPFSSDIRVKDEFKDEEFSDSSFADDEWNDQDISFNEPRCSSSMYSSFDDIIMQTPKERDAVGVRVHRPIRRHKCQKFRDAESGHLSYELKSGYNLMMALMCAYQRNCNSPFMDEIDMELEKNKYYLQIIKTPICLKTIKKKLLENEYPSITNLIYDLRLLFENTYRFYGPVHSLTKKALHLEFVMEQKIALFSNEIRDLCSLEKTSGKPPENITRSYGGKVRSKVSMQDGNFFSHLLYRVRTCRTEREKENRKRRMETMQDARKSRQLAVTEWEESLLREPLFTQMKAMWEIPQVCHFVILTSSALNIYELPIFILERSFMMPQASEALSVLMTTLLLSPQQRAKIMDKPLMPYRVWARKLSYRVCFWYKQYMKEGFNVEKIFELMGIEPQFWLICGKQNPFENQLYHEMSFHQRVWLVKTMCDHAVHNHKSLQEAIADQPECDQRECSLGIDRNGREYFHFPRFCGQDLRVYRRKQVLGEGVDETAVEENGKVDVEPPVVEVFSKKAVREFRKKINKFVKNQKEESEWEGSKKSGQKRRSKTLTREVVAVSTPRPSHLRQKPRTSYREFVQSEFEGFDSDVDVSHFGRRFKEEPPQEKSSSSSESHHENDEKDENICNILDGLPRTRLKSPSKYTKDTKRKCAVSVSNGTKKCSECGKTFRQLSALYGHTAIHFKKRNLQSKKEEKKTVVSEMDLNSEADDSKDNETDEIDESVNEADQVDKSVNETDQVDDDVNETDNIDASVNETHQDEAIANETDQDDAIVNKTDQVHANVNKMEKWQGNTEKWEKNVEVTNEVAINVTTRNNETLVDEEALSSEILSNKIVVNEALTNGDTDDSNNVKIEQINEDTDSSINEEGSDETEKQKIICQNGHQSKCKKAEVDVKKINEEKTENINGEMTEVTELEKQLKREENQFENKTKTNYVATKMEMEKTTVSEKNCENLGQKNDNSLVDVQQECDERTEPTFSKNLENNLKEADNKSCEKINLEPISDAPNSTTDHVINGITDEVVQGSNCNDKNKCKLKSRKSIDHSDIPEILDDSSDIHDPTVYLPKLADFELVVSSMAELRDLIRQFSRTSDEKENTVGEENRSSKRTKKVASDIRPACEINLHNELTQLLEQLLPWEQKLNQATVKMRKMLRQQYALWLKRGSDFVDPDEEAWLSEPEPECEPPPPPPPLESVEPSSESEEEFDDEGNPKRKLRKRRCRPQTSAVSTAPASPAGGDEQEDVGFAISSRGRIRKVRKVVDYDRMDFDKLAQEEKRICLEERLAKHKRKREEEEEIATAEAVQKRAEIFQAPTPVKRYLLSGDGHITGYLDIQGQAHHYGEASPEKIAAITPVKTVTNMQNPQARPISPTEQKKLPAVVVSAINPQGKSVFVRVVGDQATLLVRYMKSGGSEVKLKHFGQTFTVNSNSQLVKYNMPPELDTSPPCGKPVVAFNAKFSGIQNVATPVSTPGKNEVSPANPIAMAYCGLPVSPVSKMPLLASSLPGTSNVNIGTSQASLASTTQLVTAVPSLVSSVTPIYPTAGAKASVDLVNRVPMQRPAMSVPMRPMGAVRTQVPIKVETETVTQILQRTSCKLVAIPNGKGGYTLSLTPDDHASAKTETLQQQILSGINSQLMPAASVTSPSKRNVTSKLCSELVQVSSPLAINQTTSFKSEISDSSITPGQYYLQMLDNNQGLSSTMETTTNQIVNKLPLKMAHATAGQQIVVRLPQQFLQPQKIVQVIQNPSAQKLIGQPQLVNANQPFGQTMIQSVQQGSIQKFVQLVQPQLLCNQSTADGQVMSTNLAGSPQKVIHMVQPGQRLMQVIVTQPQVVNQGCLTTSVQTGQQKMLVATSVLPQYIPQNIVHPSSNVQTQVLNNIQSPMRIQQQFSTGRRVASGQMLNLVTQNSGGPMILQSMLKNQPSGQGIRVQNPAVVPQVMMVKPGTGVLANRTMITQPQLVASASSQPQQGQLVKVLTNEGERFGVRLADGRLTILSDEQYQSIVKKM